MSQTEPATASSYCAAGREALERGEMDRALQLLRRAAAVGPADAAEARDLGEALVEAGLPEEAVPVLERAAAGDPDDPSLLVDLGYLRMMAGDLHGARGALERVGRLGPDDTALRRSMGQLYEAIGDPALAADTLASVAESEPSGWTFLEVARLNLLAGRYAEAEQAFRSLARTDPDEELIAQHGRTWCRIRRGDWRGALDAALSATRLDRYNLTTAFLAYAKDRLFGHVPDAAQRQADLEARFIAELREHAEAHAHMAGGTDDVEGLNIV